MHLKAQDILFLMKLVANKNNYRSFNKLAADLGMSPSEVHATSNRSLKAKLAVKQNEKIQY